MLKAREKPEPERNAQGHLIMTEQFLKKLCMHQGLFETPSLNDQLYLHYIGFSAIENLDSYKNLATLWLENNLIKKLSGLGHLRKLTCLFLQNNSISRIENLSTLESLAVLNLAHNTISAIENLSELTKLRDLNISHNRISRTQDIVELTSCQSLTAIDLNGNSIDDTEYFFSTFCEMSNLKCLTIKGNGCIRRITNYRKTLTARIPSLNYLDDKSILDVDRLASEAWYKSGTQAEKQVLKEFCLKKEEGDKKQMDDFVKASEQARNKAMDKLKLFREEKCAELAQRKETLLSEKPLDFEEQMADIEREEKGMDTPLEEALVIDQSRVRFKYLHGEMDKYGHIIKTPVGNSLKAVEELTIDSIEDLLVENLFDFYAVYDLIKQEYNVSIEELRDKWVEYEQSLQE